VADYSEIVEHLANQLTADTWCLEDAGSYYDATYRLQTVGLSTPPDMRVLTAAIGWPRMYVDSIEERLDVEGFRLAGKSEADEQLNDWWQINGLDEESGLAHLDALVYGRSFVTVAAPTKADEPGVPLIRVESPLNMWVETDPRTREVTQALRLYTKQGEKLSKWATLYLPDSTIPLIFNGQRWVPDGPVINHRLGTVPVVPLFNRERLSDRQGMSEITPEIRSFTDAAARTVMNMQAAAELMAVPQRVFFGVRPEEIAGTGSEREVLDAYLARFLAFEDDTAKGMQFSAADLRNFTEVLDQLAKHVASYTGLPPQYLSFQSDNPASAEAIKSSESRLVRKCERKARMFGGSWEKVMRLGNLVLGKEVSTDLQRLETIWADPSTPTYASKADAVTKLYANGLGVIPKERARLDLGYTDAEREEMKQWDEDDKDEMLKILKASAPVQGNPASKPGQTKAGPSQSAPRSSVPGGSQAAA
jgi:hypothetical protein